jgi:hypothetical protein
MHIKPRRFFVLSLFSVLLALTASGAIPSVEKILPDDTLFLITTPDFTKMRELYRTSPQAQFWNDPAMKPFKDNFLSKLQDNLLKPLERDLGVHLSDYTNLLQGQITLAMTQNDWPAKESQQPGLLFLLDTKDKNPQLMKALADVRKKWVEAGKTLRTEKIRNIEFSVLPLSARDIPKTLRSFSGTSAESDSEEASTNASKSDLYFGQFESLLIVGTSAKPIEKVLTHLTGGAMPALGDLAAYDANRLALFRDAPLYGWANTTSLIDVLTHKAVKEDPDTPDPFPSPGKIVTALGVGALKTVAFSLQIANDGSTAQVFASVPESSREGIFKLFPEAKDSAPPAFVPADAVKFQRWRIDGQKAWVTFQKILGQISPMATNGINFVLDAANGAAKEKDPDFDINKNFFGNLGDDIISYQKAPRGNTLADLNSAPSLFLISSPNAEQLASAFKYLLLIQNQQAGTPKERDFLGRKIYSVPLSGSPLPGANLSDAASEQRTLSYSPSGGYVAFSTDASLVEEYLRSNSGQQKALRDMPGLTEAIAKAGGSSTGLLGFENQTETTRAVFEALRNNSSKNSGGAMALPGLSSLPNADTFKDWMDFSLLPPYDKISKYFGITAYTASENVDGLTFKMFAPAPPGLRK